VALEHAARSVEREGKKLRGGDELLTVKKWKQVQAPVQPTPGNQRSGSIAPGPGPARGV
jgi:hypothetical protein